MRLRIPTHSPWGQLAAYVGTGWDDLSRQDLAVSLVAATGLAAPIAVGAAVGQLEAGLLAAMGALAVSGAGGLDGRGVRAQLNALGVALVLALAAFLLGSVIADRGALTAVTVVMVGGASALLGGFSRGAAAASARFLTFVLMTQGLGHGSDPKLSHLVAVFLAGAACSLALSLAASAVPARNQASGATRPTPTLRQLYRRWRRSLTTLDGWQYTLRVASCLAVAELIALIWPQPKSYWIALTVAIVVQRSLPLALQRTWERAAGTAVGVLLASTFLLWVPPAWCVVLFVGALAGLRPLLRTRRYALYAVVMTPLMVLLLDLGQPATPATMTYRLVDTALGCLIALGIGYWPWARRAKQEAAAATV